MTIWIAAAVLTVCCLVLVLRPLLFGKGSVRARIGYDLAVFQDQLAEVDRDVAGGLLSADQAEAARTEIRRRMLAAASHDEAEAESEAKAGRRPIALAGILAVVLPVGAFGLYTQLGNPTLPDKPYKEVQAARMGLDHNGAGKVLEMVDSLSAKLKANPNDASGWAMLGKSYKALGRFDDAIHALRRAGELDPRNPDVWGTLGETIAAAGQGMVMPEAREAFLNALRADHRDPRARFYLGLARAQIGDAQGAVAVWRDLERDTAPNAPWMKVLREHIAEVSSEAGFAPASIAPKSELDLAGTASPGAPPPAPPAPPKPGAPVVDMSPVAPVTPHPGAAGNSQEASEEVVKKRVADLAERLKANPDDAEGWAMLGRSYKVMGDFAKARDALGKAAKLNKADLGIQMAYAEAVLNAAPNSGDKLPAEFTAVMKDVLKIAPNHSDALYYVGLAEVEAGRKDEGKALWKKLLAGLDPASAEFKELSQEIEKLK